MNKPIVNEDRNASVIRELKSEIEELKKALQNRSGGSSDEEVNKKKI